jgi:hypothetical protein
MLAQAAGKTAAQGAYLRSAAAWEKRADRAQQSEDWQLEFGSAKRAPLGRPPQRAASPLDRPKLRRSHLKNAYRA